MEYVLHCGALLPPLSVSIHVWGPGDLLPRIPHPDLYLRYLLYSHQVLLFRGLMVLPQSGIHGNCSGGLGKTQATFAFVMRFRHR